MEGEVVQNPCGHQWESEDKWGFLLHVCGRPTGHVGRHSCVCKASKRTTEAA